MNWGTFVCVFWFQRREWSLFVEIESSFGFLFFPLGERREYQQKHTFFSILILRFCVWICVVPKQQIYFEIVQGFIKFLVMNQLKKCSLQQRNRKKKKH
jgi:hypothetical protein